MARWTWRADSVFIDSLKDVAVGLADDEVGACLNSAMQHAVAEGIEVAAAHHQRKGQAGSRPRTLEDVYGSTWITAGAGSVVLLWGSVGDVLVEAVHLKQPAAEVGPLRIDHDHNTGTTTVDPGDVDPFTVLCHTPNGLAARDLAIIQRHTTEPTENQVRVGGLRVLDRLVARNLAHKRDPVLGGPTGTAPARVLRGRSRGAVLMCARTPDTPTGAPSVGTNRRRITGPSDSSRNTAGHTTDVPPDSPDREATGPHLSLERECGRPEVRSFAISSPESLTRSNDHDRRTDARDARCRRGGSGRSKPVNVGKLNGKPNGSANTTSTSKQPSGISRSSEPDDGGA